MTEWILLGIGALLTIGTGLFVASEFALVNLDRVDLESRRDRGEHGLGWVITALKRTATHLSSAQLGITLTTLLAGYTMEPALSALLRPTLSGWGVPDALLPGVSAFIAVSLATAISMIIGELIPKNFALTLPLATARFVAGFQLAFTAVFRPVVALLNGTANAVLRAMGIEPKEEISSARSAEELSSLVRRSAMEGVLEEDTATLLDRTLRFSDLTAAEVMTPRPRVSVVSRSDTATDVIELTNQTGWSRFPIVGEDVDDIVGVVHVKHAVAVPRERRADVPASALGTAALRVPDTMRLDVLLGELRQGGFQMAIVIDEHGGMAGIATLEDLVEELIGEVSDEHDRRRPGVVRRADSVTFPGLMRPDELVDSVDIHIPDSGDYETAGGFVMAALGRIPAIGDQVSVPGGVLEVMRMDGRRVDRIRFTPQSSGDAEDSEGGEAS